MERSLWVTRNDVNSAKGEGWLTNESWMKIKPESTFDPLAKVKPSAGLSCLEFINKPFFACNFTSRCKPFLYFKRLVFSAPSLVAQLSQTSLASRLLSPPCNAKARKTKDENYVVNVHVEIKAHPCKSWKGCLKGTFTVFPQMFLS